MMSGKREITNDEAERMLGGIGAALQSGRSPIKTPMVETAKRIEPIVQKYIKERDILFEDSVEMANKMKPVVRQEAIEKGKANPNKPFTFNDYVYKDEEKFFDLLQKLAEMKTEVDIDTVKEDRAVIISTPEGEEKIPIKEYLEIATAITPNMAIFINEYFIG